MSERKDGEMTPGDFTPELQAAAGTPGLETPAAAAGIQEAIQIDHSRLAKDLEQYHRPENYLFRREYRQLAPHEGALIRAIKDQAFVLHTLMEMAPEGRDRSLSKTHLEDSVMRAVRAITG